MNDANRLRPSSTPVIAPEVAEVFLVEHYDPTDDQYVEEMLRIASRANPKFVEAMDAMATRMLKGDDEDRFKVKSYLLCGAMIAYGLMNQQVQVNVLEQDLSL